MRTGRSAWLRARTGAAAWRCDSGAVAIETAMGFMLTISLVLAIMECSLMAYTYSILEDSTRDGVRYASVHGTDSATCSGPSTGCSDTAAANVVTEVKSYASTFVGNLGGMTVSVTYPDGQSTPTSRVQVAIQYTYNPLVYLPGTSQTLHVSSQGRIVY